MEPRVDTETPHTARIYDYYLGGKDNFAADRRTAERAMRSWPAVRTAVRENRAFLGRAVRYLVAEAGIRQFLDIGTGLPSANNVHEVAQGLEPSCRVVYVDNDPIVLAHAQALLTSTPEGSTAYIQPDLREPEKILGGPGARPRRAPVAGPRGGLARGGLARSGTVRGGPVRGGTVRGGTVRGGLVLRSGGKVGRIIRGGDVPGRVIRGGGVAGYEPVGSRP